MKDDTHTKDEVARIQCPKDAKDDVADVSRGPHISRVSAHMYSSLV